MNVRIPSVSEIVGVIASHGELSKAPELWKGLLGCRAGYFIWPQPEEHPLVNFLPMAHEPQQDA